MKTFLLKQADDIISRAKTEQEAIDEFVKAQGKYLRGSKFEGVGNSPLGTFVTNDKNYAKTFAKGGGKVNELFVDKSKLKISKSAGEMGEMVAKERWEATDNLLENQFKPDTEAIKRLKKKGYNAFESYDRRQLLIFDNDLIKTKKQLEKIIKDKWKAKYLV